MRIKIGYHLIFSVLKLWIPNRVRLSQLSIPFGFLPLTSCLLYLRTGTGACPYDCDCFFPLPSPVFPLPSPVSRLPSSLKRRDQLVNRGVFPNRAIAFYAP